MNRSPAFYIWWKEFRAILPLWAIAVIALLVPTLTGWRNFIWEPEVWHMFSYPVGLVAVVVAIFTREFQDRTMMSQLLLPQRRITPFLRKLLVVMVLQSLLAAIYLLVATEEWHDEQDLWRFFTVVNAVALTGGCFWALVLKQAAAGIAVTLTSAWVLPIIGLGMGNWLVRGFGGELEQRVMLGGFGVYALACATGALACWNRLQVKGETTVVSGLDTAVISRLRGKGGFIKRRAWIASLRKELGVQRFCFWLAAIMIGTATFFAVADHFVGLAIQSGGISSKGEGYVNLQDNLRGFASVMFVIFAALIPVLAGSQAFAEEAYVGNRAWQLTLPMSARRQWAIKLGTAACLSLILGIVLPGIIAWGYATLRIGNPFMPAFEPGAVPTMLLGHQMVFGTTAWCATWSQTTISAIMKGVLVVMVFTVSQAWLTAVFSWKHSNGGLIHITSPDWRWAALVLMLLALAFTLSNYRQSLLGRKSLCGQIAVLLLAVVLVLLFDSKPW